MTDGRWKALRLTRIACAAVAAMIMLTLGGRAALAAGEMMEMPSPSESMRDLEQDEVIVLVRVNGIDLREFNNYKAQIALWVLFASENEELVEDLLPGLDIHNGVIVRREFVGFFRHEGRVVQAAKLVVTVRQNWDVRDLPFDEQSIKLELENTYLPERRLRFVADKEGSGVAPDLVLPGWDILGTEIGVSTRHPEHGMNLENLEQLGLGDPDVLTRSRVEFFIDIQRQGARMFISLFTGALTSMAISLMVILTGSFAYSAFAILPVTRVGVITTAVFPAVGTALSLGDRVPYTADYTLPDFVIASAFLGIFLGFFSIFLQAILEYNRRTSAEVLAATRAVLAVYGVILLGLAARVTAAVV